MKKPRKLLIPNCRACKDYGCTGGYCNDMEFFNLKEGLVCWYCRSYDLKKEICKEGFAPDNKNICVIIRPNYDRCPYCNRKLKKVK